MKLSLILILFLLTFAGFASAGEIENDFGCVDTDPDCANGVTDRCDVRSSLTLEEGDYYMSNGIDICADNVVLDCNGAKFFGFGFEDSAGIYMNSRKGIEIKNCDIQGYGKGILMEKTEAVIRNNVLSFNDYGLLLDNNEFILRNFNLLYSIVGNQVFNNSIHGVKIIKGDSGKISDNTINSNYFSGLYIEDSEDIEIRDNEARFNVNDINFPYPNWDKNAGIFLVDSADFKIENNLLDRNIYNGLVLQNSDSVIIANNDLSYNGFHGVLSIDSNDLIISENDISHNSNNYFNCYGCFGMGVAFYNSDSSVLSDNDVSNNWHQGIWLNLSDNNLIERNNADNNWGTGIVLTYDSNYNSLIDNSANHMINFAGISLSRESDNNIISENVASNNKISGISIADSSDNVVENNVAKNNKQDFGQIQNGWGLSLLRARNNVIRNNEFSDNHIDGIRLRDSSRNNEIFSNEIIGNGRNGLFLESSSSYNSISENTITNNLLNGILIKNSFVMTVNGNRVCGNSQLDFRLEGTNQNTGDNNRCNKPGAWNDDSGEGCTFVCLISGNRAGSP